MTNQTIQTTDSLQTLDLVQLDTVTGGGIIGAGIKFVRAAWPHVKSGAKFAGKAVASTAIGTTAVRSYDWAYGKLTGAR